MAKPDRELEELDQRFAEVEKTIQSACEIMGRLREASPKIENIHQMLSEIHEIKEKTMQEIRPVKDRLECLADRHNQAARMLEGVKQELEQTREQTKREFAKFASLVKLSQVEKRLEAILTGHKKAQESLEGLKMEVRELQEVKEIIWLEISKCVSSTKLTQFEKEMDAKAIDLERKVSEQNDRLCTAIGKLSDILENQDDRIKDLVVEVSKNTRKIKIVLMVGAGALFLSAAALFLAR